MEKWHPIFHVPDLGKLMVDSTVRLAASAKKASWPKHHSKPTMFVSRCLKFGFLKKELFCICCIHVPTIISQICFCTLITLEVAPDDVLTIVYLDCTKLCVLSQPEINALGEFVEKHLFRNPYRTFFE